MACDVRVMSHSILTKNAGDLWSVSRRLRGPLTTLLTHGREVLHALPDLRGEAETGSGLERMERCGRASQPAGARRRHEGAEGPARAEFRSGLRGHQDSPLGPVALISPSGLPSLHRKSAFSPQASRPGAFYFPSGPFFAPHRLKRRATWSYKPAKPARRAGTLGDDTDA